MYQKKNCINQMRVECSAIPENESLARSLVCAFVSQLDPTIGELSDVRCAVSEAVTNAIVHGYPEKHTQKQRVSILVWLYDNRSIKLIVRDRGIGIADISKARIPMFTTDQTGERSGMGFSIMESFTDQLRVKSTPGKGTTVEMRKTFGKTADDAYAESVNEDAANSTECNA